MRKFVILFLLLSCVYTNAQNNASEIIVEFSELSIGETFAFGDFELELVGVETDSRCPKNVMCVRAGEAVVNLKVYESGKLISKEKLIFTPGTISSQSGNGNLFNSDFLKISGVALAPYPKAGKEISKDQYRLKLRIEELVD